MEWTFILIIASLVGIGLYGFLWWSVWRLFAQVSTWFAVVDPTATEHRALIFVSWFGTCLVTAHTRHTLPAFTGYIFACSAYTLHGWPFEWALGCVDLFIAPIAILGNALFWLVVVGSSMIGYAAILRMCWPIRLRAWGYWALIVVVIAIAYRLSITLPSF